MKTRQARKPAAEGTWVREGEMLIMNFPAGPWTLEIRTLTANVLVLVDLSQKDMFTFTRA